MNQEITLEALQPEEMATFKKRLQAAFTEAARADFPDFSGIIPPERDIDDSLHARGCEALQILHEGERVGGAIVTGTDASRLLDFIFIDPAHQNRHLGHAAWRALEKRYPEAERWVLVTPYHEKRNVHFYVNLCGFHITEYYNERHPDPHFPQEEAGSYPGEDGGLFRFEKDMRR